MDAKERLQFYAARAARQIGSAYDVAKITKTNYSNVCKWFRDYTKMPIAKAFKIIDYTGATLVVFREL